MDAVILNNRDWHSYAARYDNWLATATYPKIVKDVFLVDAGEKGEFHLTRFDNRTKNFQSADWPSELDECRRLLKDQSDKDNSASLPLPHKSLPSIFADAPALVAPIGLPPNNLPAPVENARIDLDLAIPHLGYTIIVFDLDYIKKEILPGLAQRYFANDNRLDYKLAVVTNSNSKKFIYSSDAGIPQEKGEADAVANLFHFRYDEFHHLLINKIKDNAQPDNSAVISSNQEIISITHHLSQEKSQASIKYVMFSNSDSQDQSGWQLLIKHRAGSLEAAVNSVRHRNLIISFGILLLLAISIATILIFTRRAQQLARQQMEFVGEHYLIFRTLGRRTLKQL
jgi:hypothetical protein